ncbi:TlpA family protein disulfide reductase [Bacillus suaedaesalsae]|nr:TlpA disulfide reductase family protein [Bacillus suaedaesalsae]
MKKLIAILILAGLIGYTIYTQIQAKNSEQITETPGETNPYNPGEKVGEALTEGPLLQKAAPDFELLTLNGDTVKLSDFKGKKVFINFWATWCPPCRDEMPEIEEFSHSNEDVVVLAINLRNTERSDENVQKYIQEGNYTFNVLLDKKGEVANQYKVLTLPTTFFVNTNGIIQYKFVGPLTIDKMNDITAKLK